MAVSLPSDLIVDVMRNADPARLYVATAKLQSLGNEHGNAGAVFADALERSLPISSQGRAPVSQAQSANSPDAYVDFERMVLRNLFESLLPRPESGAFGTGPSAGVWRSLAADQLAGLYADTGGIGIASSLAADERKAAEPEQSQWPYFSTEKIEAFTG
jgi:hypothetical protein